MHEIEKSVDESNSTSSLPQTQGSNPINTKLDKLGFTNKETYFVPGESHEFYGTTNGTWSNGTGGNSYWPIVFNKIVQFFWEQHKPTVDYTWTTNNQSVSFSDTSTGSQAWWWDFGDGTYSNDQNPINVYATSGDYQVKFYIENTIKSWDEIIKTITVSNLALHNFGQQVFLVSPNPTKDVLKVTSPISSERIDYTIIDITGKVVLQNSLPQNAEILLSGFSSGLYFLKLTTASATQILKIIKE